MVQQIFEIHAMRIWGTSKYGRARPLLLNHTSQAYTLVSLARNAAAFPPEFDGLFHHTNSRGQTKLVDFSPFFLVPPRSSP